MRKHKERRVVFNMEDEPIAIDDSDGENASDDITENGTAHACTGARNNRRKKDRSIYLHASAL